MNVWLAFGLAALWGAAPDIASDARWMANIAGRINRVIPLWTVAKISAGFAFVIFAPRLAGLAGIDVGDGSLNPITNIQAAISTLAHH